MSLDQAIRDYKAVVGDYPRYASEEDVQRCSTVVVDCLIEKS